MRTSLFTLVLAVLVAASDASAQVVHIASYVVNGDSANDQFGSSVSGAGDVNNDGFDDLIVGASGDDNNGSNSGSARVLSGATGAILYTFDGDSANDLFGSSVSGAGDVNNDGFDDLIVGAYQDDNNGTNSGSARVFSGATGAILYTFNGDSANDLFGSSVSGAGDVNNDGFDDLIVGARNDDNIGIDSGSARVLSGANGAILYTFNGDSASDQFGSSVSGAGDVNNDGFADLIVGASGDDNNGSDSGSARVFSGATGAILSTFNGDSAGDSFGISVSGAGDVNNDGFDDLIVGAFRDDNNGSNSGSARVFSGATGAILYTFNGDSAGDNFGRSVSGAGDVNNDGFDDLIVGAVLDDNNGDASGNARVFSGANGSILFSSNGDSANDVFGTSVSGAGDVNNDGFDDLIVGAPFNDSSGTSSGRVRVFVSAPVCPGDADSSRVVTFADISAVLAAFGLPTYSFGPGDADGSGAVTFTDIGSVLANFGNTCQ
jgi:predicted lipoprotein with Yx(FWY)xxD motif